jgi:glucosamine--fructose-6-phosphate aminotransferase (isomerizing)
MTAGEGLLGEIREQPAALRRLAADVDGVRSIAERVAARQLVRLVGHGSSDNAASYAVYAFGLLAGATAVRDSISLSAYYQAELDFSDSAVVALSQSGETRDVVSYVERARGRGAFTVAVTNEPASPLAAAAEAVLPLAAGAERSIAATKTYLNQLGALALLAGLCGGRDLSVDVLATADVIEAALAGLERAVAELAVPFAFAGRMFVTGRGVEFATARETALKLTEICRVAAEPLTATDLVHGPVAALDPLFPVWVIASDDAALPSVVAAAARARSAGATMIAAGAAAARIEGAAYVLETPPAPQPVLSPLVSVVPGQLFAWSLARAKGLDPDVPTHLTKVTVTP